MSLFRLLVLLLAIQTILFTGSPAAHAIDSLEDIDLTQDRQLLSQARRKDGLNIYRHKLNYLISGKPDTKVQFSFKVQLINDTELYFAYTQVMFWELFQKESSPFQDVNYNPELFYRWHVKNGILRGIDLGFWEHKSNGRAGPDSRSFDRTYLGVSTEFEPLGVKTVWESKLFYVYSLDKENPDIKNNLGFLETTLRFPDVLKPWLDESELYVSALPGGKFDWKQNYGSYELGLKFRIPVKNVNPFLYFQYFWGHTESLLNYRELASSYRLGLAI